MRLVVVMLNAHRLGCAARRSLGSVQRLRPAGARKVARVFLRVVLDLLPIRPAVIGFLRSPRLGEHFRIFDGDRILQRATIGGPDALGDVHLITMSTTTREARVVLEAAGIDDEGFTLPMADRMALLARQSVGGMTAPIGVDFARAAVGGH